MGRLPEKYIKEAKATDLIGYMLTNHEDRVVKHYGIRDAEHDSLLLYPNGYCRFSTLETGDSIDYLIKYQGYTFRDAAVSLHRFKRSNHAEIKAPECQSCYREPQSRNCYRPHPNGRMKEVEEYLHAKRGISMPVIERLIEEKCLYAADAKEYGSCYACFANDIMEFYCLRNITDTGIPKLCFTKEPDGFWWFSSRCFEDLSDIKAFHEYIDDPYGQLPLFICEAPIDSISLYELTKKPGIYIAMAGLKQRTILRAMEVFAGIMPVDMSPHKVILAVDNDAAGDRFAKDFPITHERIIPEHKDWNEDLMARTGIIRR